MTPASLDVGGANPVAEGGTRMSTVSFRLGRRASLVLTCALLAMPAALPLAAAAGAQDAEPADLSGLEGQIEIDGSSTVAPITEAVAEEFAIAGAEDVEVAIGVSGTGGGFERFCNGETDIQDASRAIEQEEIDACAENGVEYYELEIGSDGITVAVNPANDFLTCISTASLAQIWGEDGSIDTFAALNPEFPDEEITLYGPGPDSGTFDFFNETILGEDILPTTDYTPSEDDNVLVEGVAGDENALGYFGYAYYAGNEDRVRSVALATAEDLSDCVEPSAETIRDGSYVLSRPLYIYAKAESLKDASVQELVRFYVANAEFLVEEVGYVPLPSEEYAAAREKVEGAICGEVEPDGASAGDATPEA